MQLHAVKDYDTYARSGQFQEAAKCLQTALRDKPNDLETFYMLHRLGEKILDSTLKNKIDRIILAVLLSFFFISRRLLLIFYCVSCQKLFYN